MRTRQRQRQKQAKEEGGRDGKEEALRKRREKGSGLYV
jgi:hypothetical protein